MTKMPRQAHGRSLSAAGNSRPPKRKSTRSRNLDAFAIAEKENSTKIRVRRNRLGEIEEDSHDRTLLAKRDHDEGEHPAKRRRIHGQDSSTDGDRAGSDSDGEKWHFGVENDDDDSDIDSGEAMGASDEEKFEGFAFRGSSAQKSKRLSRKKELDGMEKSTNIDLQESSHEDASDDYENQSSDEDGLGEDAVDLATALDLNEDNGKENGQRQRESSTVATQSLRDTRYTDDSNGSSEDDSSASEDAHSALSVSDDEDLGASHTRLQSFVQGLEIQAPSDAASKRVRPPIAVGEPSDYGLASSQKLTISDLLSTVTDPQLRESLKMLHNSEQKASTTSTRGMPGKLDPPLPKRQQDRLDREAAYEKSIETLSRWIDTVKQNRRAEHISFPLSDPNAIAALGTNQLMPVSHLEAVTPLESAIQSIMLESGLASKNGRLAEEKEQAFEELQERKMSIEEVQFRRAELRKARDLMFREEIRARRINKIKSKAYRRVHRKERDKHAQEAHAALAAAGALDSEDERERQDRQRAEERMGARHKESKWAKGVKATGRAVWDEDARSGLGDLGRKDEELRKRIEGKEPTQPDKTLTDSSDEESSDNISIDEYDEVEGLKLTQKLGDLEMVKQAKPSESRLSSMPFMQKAEAARRAANEANIDGTRRILAGEDAEAEGKEKSLAETGGRGRFGLGQQGRTETAHRAEEKNGFEEPPSEDETRQARLTGERTSQPAHDMLPKNAANVRKVTVVESGGRKKEQDMRNDNDNPWLSGPRSRKSGHTTDGPIISTKDSLQIRKQASNEFKSRQMTSQTRVVRPSTMEDLTSPSESETESRGKYAGHEQSSRRNEELVRMAFAGDDVFQAFTDEKKAIMDEEGDQVVDTTLPGWGSWTGAGISKKESRRANSCKSTTTVKGIDPTKRKDAKLDRVLINEKRVKKNVKYLAPELPHPFESRQQYERSLRLPLGPEWTTKTTFQDATKPRVLVRQGVIRPMEKPIA